MDEGGRKNGSYLESRRWMFQRGGLLTHQEDLLPPKAAGPVCLGCCRELLDEDRESDEMNHTKPPPGSDSPGLWHFVGFEI